MKMQSVHHMTQVVGGGAGPSRTDHRGTPRRELSYSHSARPDGTALRAIAWAAIAIAAVAYACPALPVVQSEVEPAGTHGSVGVKTTGSARWTINPDLCMSGDAAGFFGVHLLSSLDRQRSLQIARAIDGSYVVTVHDADRPLSVSKRDIDCAEFKIDLTRTRRTFAGISEMEGVVRLSCVDGDTDIHAAVDFKRCF